MCLAQGPQRSDAGEARTRGPSVSSQALNLIWTFIKLSYLNVNVLFSLCISIYFSIIRISKYVIKMCNTSIGILSALTVLPKIKAPEARDL